MRWITLIAWAPLVACSALAPALAPLPKPEPGPQANWTRQDGSVLTPAETEQALGTCIGRMRDLTYLTSTPDFQTARSYQAFNEKFQNSTAFDEPSSAEINTCMHAKGYQLAR